MGAWGNGVRERGGSRGMWIVELDAWLDDSGCGVRENEMGRCG